MSDNENKEAKIKWLYDFYGWECANSKEKSFFSIEDYVTINGDIQLVRIDPDIANDSLWEAKNIKLFQGQSGKGFKLYQCDSPSKIRRNIPIRFLYSKRYGKAFELKGSNVAFYEMFKFIYDNSEIKKDILGNNVEDWFQDDFNIKTYIRVFFDNVTGRHGRFEIIETYKSDLTNKKSYCLLLNRIKKYYERNNFQRDNILSKEEEILHKNFHKNLNLHLDERDKQSIQTSFENSQKFPEWRNCYMIFKDTLFTADIMVRFDEQGIGFVSLSHEDDISHYDIYPPEEKTNLSSEDQEKLKKQTSIYLPIDEELKEMGIQCFD